MSVDALGAARALDLFLLGCQSRVVGGCWRARGSDARLLPTPLSPCGRASCACRRRVPLLPPARSPSNKVPQTAPFPRAPPRAGTTNLNLRSSRAHAIFSLLLSRRPAAERGVTYTSKLHVVDLAGSERCKRTKAEGAPRKRAPRSRHALASDAFWGLALRGLRRFGWFAPPSDCAKTTQPNLHTHNYRRQPPGARMKEAISINSGLLVLQKVMAALQLNSRRNDGGRDHVPYRESRLTRLLQASRRRRGARGRALLAARASYCALLPGSSSAKRPRVALGHNPPSHQPTNPPANQASSQIHHCIDPNPLHPTTTKQTPRNRAGRTPSVAMPTSPSWPASAGRAPTWRRRCSL